MTFIVALTGGIGSGKSTVTNMFAQLAVPIIDTDLIARELVLPGTPALSAIVHHFGGHILQADGQLNRNLLRERIFNHPADRTWLNQLLHPLITQESQRQLCTVTAPYTLWVVPLLIENSLQQYADRVLLIDVDENTQLARTLERDTINHQQAANIVAVQASREARRAHAHDIIDNSGTLAQLTAQIMPLHQCYLSLANSTSSAGRIATR